MSGPVALRGLTWAHTRGFAPLAALGRVWEDFNPGEKIVWEARSLRSFGEDAPDTFAGDYDLIVFDYPHAGAALQSGGVLPLDSLLSPETIAARREGTIGPGFDAFLHDGQLAALPIDMATHVSVWRPDLLGTPPRDWQDVLELARSGQVAMPMRPTGVWGAFLTICANAGHPPFQDADNPLETEVAEEALSMLRELAQLVKPSCFEAYPVALLNQMARDDGPVFMPFTYGYSIYGLAGYARHRLRFGAVPLGPHPVGAVMGGAGIGILKGCRNQDLAARHIEWLTSPEVQAGPYVFAGGQPAQRFGWDCRAADDLYGGFFGATRQSAETAYVRPSSPRFHGFQNEAASVAHAAIIGKLGTKEAVIQISAGWLGTRAP